MQFLWRRYESRLQPVREALAGFIGVDPCDLVFVTNTTVAVNAVVRSWKLKPGDEILTTNLDYNACRNVLIEIAAAAGAEVVVAEIPFPISNDEQAVAAILDRVTSQTRYAMIDHVTSGSALVLPVERIIRGLEARGVEVLVDGAHAPGMLPLNVAALNASWYCGNLHKWVCAPKGSAFLWARNDRQCSLMPAVISHGNNTPRSGFSAFQDRFDWAGTFDPTAWFCVPEAIRWMDGVIPGGWDAVRNANHQLAIDARRMLCDALDVPDLCPDSMIGSMATVLLPERFQNKVSNCRPVEEQARLYDEFGIEVPFVSIGNLRGFRVSAQLYNHRDEFRFLGAILRSI